MCTHYYDGEELLSLLLEVSTPTGKIKFDDKTMLPVCSLWDDDYCVNELRAMMRAYNIQPKAKDFPEGLTPHRDYLYCFVKEEFSEKRKEAIVDLLLKYKDDECIKDFWAIRYGKPVSFDNLIKGAIESALYSRLGRYDLFRFLFRSRKQWHEIRFSMYGRPTCMEVVTVADYFVSIMYYKYLRKFESDFDTLLVLLMGDYADEKLEHNMLVRECGFPGILQNSEDDLDLPF